MDFLVILSGTLLTVSRFIDSREGNEVGPFRSVSPHEGREASDVHLDKP